MTPEQLRGSILQYAIQGKLVEHRNEEGNAKDILQRIYEKKSILIKNGEAKKSKTLTPISDEEKLFDIPENWQWIKLGEIASLITKGTTPRGGNVAYLDKGIGFLRAENVAGLDILDKSNLKYIDEETHNGYLKRSIIEANDILITIAGTLGRTGLVREEDLPLNANQAVSMVRLVDISDIDLKYIIYVLNSPEIQAYLTQQKKTTAIPNLTLEIIENCVCPLPPLAEQHRIVAKIEEMLPFVDRYAASYEKLEQFNAKFPEDMKKSILQYAIQGKLVEQRPEEGTAEDLYKEIQEEKQKLIKEGKIKKEKRLAEITEDEIPFDIPDSWKWVRMGEIGDTNIGLTYKPTDKTDDGTIVLRSSNIQNGLMDYADIVKVGCDIPERARIAKGDLLICARNGSRSLVGKSAIVDKDGMAFGAFMAKFCSPINDYLIYFLQSPIFRNQLDGVKTETINQITQDTLRNQLLPLPPRAEQERIIAKIKELLPYCDQLIK